MGHLRSCVALALSLALAACSQAGDFGRPRASAWDDGVAGMTGAIRQATTGQGDPLLTDDEQELRARAWRFLNPARTPEGFTWPRSGETVTEAYWSAITSAPDRSPRARYQRIREDAEAERQLVTPFAATACRVADTDRVRLAALDRIADPGEAVRATATARVEENRDLVGSVRLALEQREAAFRSALERLTVESPDRDAVKAERTITGLAAARTILDRCWSPAAPVRTAGPAAPFYPKPEKELPPK